MAPNFSFDAGAGFAFVSKSAFLASAAIIVFITAAAFTRRYLAKTTTPPPHILTFPPTRRHVLSSFPQFEKTKIQPEILASTLKRRALTTTKKADLSKDNLYTPMGFATQEIRALGRFPDYSILTGVRHPEPCSPSWDISKAVFRPFRPFRWGYHQHMALMKYEPDWWVELEQNYHKTMAARKALLSSHGDRIFFQGPGADLAARELMEMLLQFLCKRYPQHFSLSNNNSILHNGLLNTTTDLLTTPPLRVLFDTIPEDYAIMLRNESDGFYYLRAAMVCSSVGWDIAQHRDEPLRDIHTHVPDYASKMAMSMDRYFSKMPTDAPVNRCSWSIEDWEAMWSSPEVDAGWTRSAFSASPEKLTYKDLKLRCDAQTLRRLPMSGAVVFNFKAVFAPFEELRTEAYIPALLHRVLLEGKENLITYKCVDNVRRVAMDALEKWAADQVAQGVVPPDWEVGTLEESPFFPGWREKWARQQGF
ncbi:hypothetical protein B0H63DRAFT_399290 [Podospora didyma]|uniref:Uncharacterized protein n=1 Tax=Podospora didyma TaxID=330526 RepID=A0AAE0N9R9_9PEZI|nr:hypothetical protein B0H63DRAFT_399290 [Podospora didyma]